MSIDALICSLPYLHATLMKNLGQYIGQTYRVRFKVALQLQNEKDLKMKTTSKIFNDNVKRYIWLNFKNAQRTISRCSRKAQEQTLNETDSFGHIL